MNKYQIGQRLFHIKYKSNLPELRVFDVWTVKQDRDGFKYCGSGSYQREEDCFLSTKEAVENACKLLMELMDE